MDLNSYEYTGNELLDRFDNLKALQDQTRFQLELYNEIRREHAENVPTEFIEIPYDLKYIFKRLDEAKQDLDKLFEEEKTKFPIKIVGSGSKGEKNTGIAVIETNSSNYQEMAEALAEINCNLADSNPRIDYSQAPSPIATIDYSDELISEHRRLQATYKMFEEII